jgi:dTDP-4-dehydrorhamnose 3,5-epimerase
MKVEKLAIPDVLLLTPPRFGDSRGFFSEVFKAEGLRAAGIEPVFIQDNQSFSAETGTLRGLHCQINPAVQGKLVRVLRGAIYDVAIDIRGGSASYGQWVAAELSAENFSQLWIPPGFLHGFCTLTADTEVLYKVTGPYSRDAERGVIWNDSHLAIPWPLAGRAPELSDKDKVLPGFAAAKDWFPA